MQEKFQLFWVAGRLKNFIENSQNLTSDTEILSLVEGYAIPFHEIPQQKSIPNSPNLSQTEKILIQNETQDMLNKGAITETPNHLEGEFINNLFLIEKKDDGNRPVINLKRFIPLNFIPDQHLKMEDLHCLGNILEKVDCMCKQLHSVLSTSIKSWIQEVRSVSLVGETLRVFSPLFWARSSTKNFYKINQNSGFSVTSSQHTS